MRIFSHLIAVILLCLTGCSSPTLPDGDYSPIELSTDESEYTAGDELRLYLRNGMSVELTYNLCAVRLQRLVQTNWEMVGEAPLCDLIEYILPPGNIAFRDDELPSPLSPGTYRFVIAVSVEAEAALTYVPSPAFTVV